jgi:hypothetical protein
MIILHSWAEVKALAPGHEIFRDGENEWRCYAPGEIVREAPPANPVPQEVSSYQAMKALAAAGLADAFEAWANDPARTFLERAAVNRPNTWVRSDPVLIAAATDMGIGSAQLDDLFRLADTL